MTVEFATDGQPVTCDGCGAPVERVTDAMKHPVPAKIAQAVYGRAASPDFVYIVCTPLPGGTQPCLDIALLADELYELVRCRIPGCDGGRCQPQP